jgi:radical SAM protein with 4Fe4S-binding SPASM domain
MAGIWTDRVNLASKLTPQRVANGIQVLRSYYASRITGKPDIKGLPISISIEPTTSCNLRCPECPSGLRSFTRPTGMLKDGVFRAAIDQLANSLTYLTFYFQGEPYLNPRFLEMVRYASDRKIYTATSTNGHYLTDEVARDTVASGLDRLIISIDGTTQESYESYRIGGSLEKVLEGAANVSRWKGRQGSKTPHLIFQFLVVKQNEHQIADVKSLASQTGIDQVLFKSAQIYDYRNGSPFIPDNGKYSRYRKRADGTFEIKNKLLNHCWKMWNSCVITWDGKIVPCCFDKDAHFVLGDLTTQSFSEVWHGEAYRSFRTSLLRSRNEIEICQNCTEGTRVWV